MKLSFHPSGTTLSAGSAIDAHDEVKEEHCHCRQYDREEHNPGDRSQDVAPTHFAFCPIERTMARPRFQPMTALAAPISARSAASVSPGCAEMFLNWLTI